MQVDCASARPITAERPRCKSRQPRRRRRRISGQNASQVAVDRHQAKVYARGIDLTQCREAVAAMESLRVATVVMVVPATPASGVRSIFRNCCLVALLPSTVPVSNVKIVLILPAVKTGLDYLTATLSPSASW